MKSKTEKTGRRVVWDLKNYTALQRIRLRAKYLLDAATWESPKNYLVARYLHPGDAGYEAATEEEVIIWSDVAFEREVPND